jgi:two-component sensor histidine kinase
MLKKLRAQPRRVVEASAVDPPRRRGAGDMSARAAELEAALAAQSRRLRELDHLTRNNLQTLSAITLLKARRCEDADTRRSLQTVAERIGAVSAAHRALDPENPKGRFDVSAFVADLAADLAATIDAERIGLTLDLEPLEAPERDAAAIALLVNELVTNALRHAFPDQRKGRIAIAIRADGRIVVADNGIGMPAAPPRDAFGRVLAEMLARQLGAELRLEDARPGTRVVVMLR